MIPETGQRQQYELLCSSYAPSAPPDRPVSGRVCRKAEKYITRAVSWSSGIEVNIYRDVALKATITAFLSAILYLSKQRTEKTPLNRYLNREGYFE